MDETVIRETIKLWEKEPDKAKGSPIVKARAEGSQAILESGPFTWRADLPAALGGKNEAPSPTAFLLGALAGCAVVFIRDTLAPQLGVRIESVSASAKCKADSRGLLGLEGSIADLQELEVSIEIESSDSEENVQRLYQTWRERCPVYLALTKTMPVKTTMCVKREL